LARISGVDLPRNKSIAIALSYIYGIGQFQSKKILDSIGIDHSVKTGDLSEEQILSIRNEIDDNFTVEGELRSQVGRNIKRLIDVGTYRGSRHKNGLPVNGQNTKNNARTRKGKKRTVANKKKAV
jgi:small subunit ribosomal protein S13|tara:strand:+ start:605 stop:979 length:375 start_codon:yes stop_codon:yes gene_type:complete